MPINVNVPPLGESVTQATLLRWIKNDGEAVAKDEPIAELETDKANVDLPSPAAGVLRHGKKPGDTVQVGEAVARVEEGGTGTAPSAPAATSTAKAQAGGGGASAPAASTATATRSPTTETGSGSERVTAKLEDLSPAVRRLVEENNLNPTTIPATGPNGRLT